MKSKFLIIIILGLFILPHHGSSQTEDSYKTDRLQSEQKNEKLLSEPDVFLETGSNYFNNGHFGEAYEQFQLFIDATKQTNDKPQLIKAYTKVASIYKDKQVLDVALNYYLKALSLSATDKDKQTGDIYINIGGIYYDQHNFEKAQEFYRKSLETYLKNDERQELAASYNNLGEMYRFQGDYKRALESYKLAVVINKEFNNTLFLAINYNNIGGVYLSQKKYKKAFENINNSRILLEKGENIELIASSYSSIGDYYFETAEYEKAIENYYKTLNFNLENYSKKNIIIKDAYYGLSKVFNKLENIEKELEYYKKYTHLKDSVFNSEKHKSFFEIQTKYEIRQKEKEIIYLQEKAKKDEEEKKKQGEFLIIGIVLLALIVLLLVYSYILKSGALKQKTLLFEQTNKLNRLEIKNREIDNKKLLLENKAFEAREEISRLNREKLKSELEHKERELSTTALHVIGKNEMISNLKSSMEKLIEDGQRDSNKVLRDLIREIENNINLDKDWDAFKMHFEKVHSGFFTRLKDSYFDLTVDELKLSAYLRINLSSKEIAQILNITQPAINKRRNRLRKKLKLDASDNLFDFMNKV